MMEMGDHFSDAITEKSLKARRTLSITRCMPALLLVCIAMGCVKSGKLHVDVWFPGPAKPGVDMLKSRVDANDKSEGNMTYAFALPNNTTVYCTEDGYTALKVITRESRERVAEHGWEPYRFEVIEDNASFRIRNWFMRRVGPRLGRPEISQGDLAKK
jgi:hypothetical protein